MRKCLIIAVFILLTTGLSNAQNKITGQVKDASGEPVIGANVVVKGTTHGTVTDVDGNFSLTDVPADATLVFSFIGMLSKEIEVSNQTLVNVSMEADFQQLDEVVVIGYGTVKKRDLTGSVSSVKTNDIVKLPTHNPLEAIQGKVSGVDITRSSGQAGAGININIRGHRSIGTPEASSGSNQQMGSYEDLNKPLVIIDGVQGGSYTDLNSNDIESIEILKDASSTAIYGYQGANGVILITTKKGKEGKTKVSYSGYYGVNGMTPYPSGRMGEDYIALRREAYKSANHYTTDEAMFTPAEWEAIQKGQWINWNDLLLSNGSLQSHQLSVSGGSSKTQSYLSAGYYKEIGAVKDDFSRFNARLNLDHTVFKWAKVGMQSQVAYTDQNKRKDAFGKANSASPLGVPYDEEGNIIVNPMAGDNASLSPLTDLRPNAAIDNVLNTKILTTAYLELSPFEGFSLRSNIGTNLQYRREGIFNDSLSMQQYNLKYNKAIVYNDNSRSINWDNIATFSRELGSHSFTITALTSYQKDISERYAVEGIDQPLSSYLFYNLVSSNDSTRIINSSYRGTKSLSYAGRLNYSFKGRYLLTITDRFDGASQLAKGHKWSSFPSVALAWRVSDEPFLKNSRFISNLKFRYSYGEAGNASVSAYGTQTSIIPAGNMSFGNVGVPSYSFDEIIGNNTLGWERSATNNAGVDLGFFKNRVNITFDAYDTKTSNILFKRKLPVSLGGMSSGATTFSIWQNIGKTQNKGIELSINSVNVQSKNFSWTSTLSFSKNVEKITDLIEDKDIIVDEENSLLLDRPIKSFYTYRKIGIWQTGDSIEMTKFTRNKFKIGDIKLTDINGDTLISNLDRTYIGSAVPDWVCGFQNTFTYWAFDFSIYIFARWGQMIQNDLLGRYNPSGTGNGPAYLNYWTPTNPTNDFPRPNQGVSISDYMGYQALTYVDGSYFKIKNITLGFTLPKKLSNSLHIEKFRIYATASNLYTYVNSHLVKNYDPENGGSEQSPMSKQVVFGINLDF